MQNTSTSQVENKASIMNKILLRVKQIMLYNNISLTSKQTSLDGLKYERAVCKLPWLANNSAYCTRLRASEPLPNSTARPLLFSKDLRNTITFSTRSYLKTALYHLFSIRCYFKNCQTILTIFSCSHNIIV